MKKNKYDIKIFEYNYFDEVSHNYTQNCIDKFSSPRSNIKKFNREINFKKYGISLLIH